MVSGLGGWRDLLYLYVVVWDVLYPGWCATFFSDARRPPLYRRTHPQLRSQERLARTARLSNPVPALPQTEPVTRSMHETTDLRGCLYGIHFEHCHFADRTGVTRGQFPASTFQRKAGICRESISKSEETSPKGTNTPHRVREWCATNHQISRSGLQMAAACVLAGAVVLNRLKSRP